MSDCYSYIFSKIVQEDGDFVGMVAYTIYKRQKIEWIEGFKKDNGRHPNDDEMAIGFGKVSNLPSQIEAYREQAVIFIDRFLDEALIEAVTDIKDKVRNDAIVSAVKKSFWRGVLENVVAGFTATLITLGATGLLWVAFQGPKNLVKKMIDGVVENGEEKIYAPTNQLVEAQKNTIEPKKASD